MDYLTKWPEVFATSNQEALTIAKLLAEHIVPRHGVPRKLLSDRGANFLSKLMTELYRLLGIQKVNTTAYHPQTDGLVERFNRTLTDMLAKSAKDNPRNWDKRLPQVLFAYRTSPQESTELTPFMLLHGREAVLPTQDALFPVTPIQGDHYLSELTEKLSSAWKLAQENIRKAQGKQKRCYDRRAKKVKYQVGDKVLLYMPATCTGELRKLALPNRGPYLIKEIGSSGATIQECKPRSKPILVAINRLRPYPEGIQMEPSESSSGGQNPAGPETRRAEVEETEMEVPETWKTRLRPRIRYLTVMRTSQQGWGRCNTSTLRGRSASSAEWALPVKSQLVTTVAAGHWLES